MKEVSRTKLVEAIIAEEKEDGMPASLETEERNEVHIILDYIEAADFIIVRRKQLPKLSKVKR